MSSFKPVSIPVPAEVAAGAAVAVTPRSPLMLGLSGTFVGTVQFQYSPDSSGDVWLSIGSAKTAPGLAMLPAGRAKRVRANTSAYTSGTPVGTMLHDVALSITTLERTFKEADLDIETSVAIGDALDLEDGEQAIITVSGTFTATVQIEISLSEAGDDWFAWGQALTAAGIVILPRGIARRVRANTTAYTSGTPLGTLVRGFSAEDVADGRPVTAVADGLLSVLVPLILLDITGTQAWTLPDGVYYGQVMYFGVIAAASTPVGVVTITNFVDGASLTFGATTNTAAVMWTPDGWKLLELTGATLA